MSSNYFSSPSIIPTTNSHGPTGNSSSNTLATSSGSALSGIVLSNGSSITGIGTGTSPNSNNIVSTAPSTSSFLTVPSSSANLHDTMFGQLFSQAEQDLLDLRNESTFPYLPYIDSMPMPRPSRQSLLEASLHDTIWRQDQDFNTQDSPFSGYDRSGIHRSVFSSFSDYNSVLDDTLNGGGDASGVGNDRQHHGDSDVVVVPQYADPHSRPLPSEENAKKFISDNEKFLAKLELMKKMLEAQLKPRNKSITSGVGCDQNRSQQPVPVVVRSSPSVVSNTTSQNRNNFHTPQDKAKRGGRIVQSSNHTAVHSQEFVSKVYQPRNYHNQRNSIFSNRRNSLPPVFLSPELNESRKTETERKNILQKLIVDTEVSNSSLKKAATPSSIGTVGNVRRPSFQPGVSSIAEQNLLDGYEEKSSDNKMTNSKSQSRNAVHHSSSKGTVTFTPTNAKPKERPPTPVPGSIDKGKDFILPPSFFSGQSGVIDPAFNFSPDALFFNHPLPPPPGFGTIHHGLHRYNGYGHNEPLQPMRLNFKDSPEKARDEFGVKWFPHPMRPSPSSSESSNEMANSLNGSTPEHTQNPFDSMFYKHYPESNGNNGDTPHKTEGEFTSDDSPISMCTISTPSSRGEPPISPEVAMMEVLLKHVSKETPDSPIPVVRKTITMESQTPMDVFNSHSNVRFAPSPSVESKKNPNVITTATSTRTRTPSSPFSLPSLSCSKHQEQPSALPSSASRTMPSSSSATTPNPAQFIPAYASVLANAAAFAAVAMQQNAHQNVQQNGHQSGQQNGQQNPHQFGHITGLQNFTNYLAQSQNGGQHGSDLASSANAAAPFFQYLQAMQFAAAFAASNSANANSGTGNGHANGGGLGGSTSPNSAALAMAAAFGFPQVPVAATTNPFDATSFTSPVSVKDELDLKAKDHREAASRVSECEVVYSIPGFTVKPPDNSKVTFSKKVFFGGTPWDISNEEMFEIFGHFGAESIIRPGKDVQLARGSTTAEKAGYLYIIFQSDECVKKLLEACILSMTDCDHKFFFQVTSKKSGKTKKVQVVPCVVDDMRWFAHDNVIADPSRTIFLGALHGMMSASIIRNALEINFGPVEYVTLDSDKYQYSTGSGKAMFTHRQSYLKAIQVSYIHFKSNRFEKTVQIDPYMEDRPCSRCTYNKGPYLCRECFKYFCDVCCHHYHSDPSRRHHRILKKNCGNHIYRHSPK